MRISVTRVALLAGLSTAAAVALSPAVATGAPSAQAADVDRIEKQIQDLQEEVRRLTRSDASTEELIDDKIRQAKPVAGYKPGGFFIQNQKGDYVLRIGGYFQLDGRFFPGDPQSLNPDQFLIRRARPIMEGSLGSYLDFKFMPDFAGTVRIFDAYADVKPFADAKPYSDWLKIRTGKFKTPLGLERLQSATVLPLVERGAPTNLVPTRGLGAELFGSYLGGVFGYELGAFDQAPDLSNVDGQLFDDFNFIGRVFSQPFVTTDVWWLQNLSLAMAGSYGMEQGSFSTTNLPTYRSFGQSAIFSYVVGPDRATTAIADGIASRWNPQASWYVGPFGVEAEYVSSRTPVTLDDVSETLDNRAWVVTASWALTGESESWRGVGPLQAFEPWTNRWTGHWGAVELVARVDALKIDPNAFEKKFVDPNKSIRKDFGFGGGLNWIWSRNVKLALDYYHTDFQGGQKGGTYNRPTEDAVIGRVQFAL